MTGRVRGLRPSVEIRVRGYGEPAWSIEFTVDTGFAGFLALPTAEASRLGLPFVRTSPDHGTAYDIAGKGIANPSSMIAAINLAKRLIAN